MRLILVGGFLGAGKTTLLAAAAQQLTARGLRVGLITNDQVPGLVDTALLSRAGADAGVREVAGSCFCCNFDGFRDAVHSLDAAGATCILAEPVGSCTDLSATILQPLKAQFPEITLAPLSVLIDPARVRGVLQNERPLLHADAAYILRVQLEEADQIVLTKADTISAAEHDVVLRYLAEQFPHAPISTIAASNGMGIEAWLSNMLANAPSGTRIATVDYDRYAHGEAVLGWLNAIVQLRWIGNLQAEWEQVLKRLLDRLQAQLRSEGCEVGHIKLLLETTDGLLAANLTGLEESPQLRREGGLARLSGLLTLNARVQVAPSGIDRMVREALAEACHGCVAPTITAFHCIQPGRPTPTHRYEQVVT